MGFDFDLDDPDDLLLVVAAIDDDDEPVAGRPDAPPASAPTGTGGSGCGCGGCLLPILAIAAVTAVGLGAPLVAGGLGIAALALGATARPTG
jgi:hypothetical protein